MSGNVEDITPEGSAAPVFHTDELPDYVEPPALSDPAEQIELRASALAKLTALGLTEEEARALAGA